MTGPSGADVGSHIETKRTTRDGLPAGPVRRMTSMGVERAHQRPR